MSEFEIQKNAGEYPLTSHKTHSSMLHKDVSADFVLPDYMGDVKRVLKYSACAIPCNKLVSADEASFLAVVTFRVTYIDNEDMLTEAAFSADCEITEKLSGNILDADSDYRVQSVAIRLGGPRKISAKATVLCEVGYVEDFEICEKSEFSGAEMLKKETKIHSAEYLKCGEREYAEEIDKIEEIAADELEVVKSFAEAFVDAVHKTDGGINVSGYVDASCVLRSEEELIRLEKRIPVEEHIECDLRDGGVFIPKAYVTGFNVNLNDVNNDDSCYVSVVMNMTVECFVTQHYNEHVCVVCDAFYEGCENRCGYEKIEFAELGETVYDKASFTSSFERADEHLYDILEKEITVKNLRYDSTGTDVTVFCEAELNLIARGNNAEACYPIKEKLSFSKKYRIVSNDNTKIQLNATPCDVSVSFDAEKIYVDTELLISLITENEKTEKILIGLECDEYEEKKGRSLVVYYPEKDDTLWSVSKKYAVSPVSIMKNNPAVISASDYNVNLFNLGTVMIAK